MNVYPQDLEAALRRQPSVHDRVVIAWPTAGNAEPCAVLLLEPTADAGRIVSEANRGCTEYQQMRRSFRLCTRMPISHAPRRGNRRWRKSNAAPSPRMFRRRSVHRWRS